MNLDQTAPIGAIDMNPHCSDQKLFKFQQMTKQTTFRALRVNHTSHLRQTGTGFRKGMDEPARMHNLTRPFTIHVYNHNVCRLKVKMNVYN